MKQLLFLLLSIAIGNSAFAQGLTKNGKVTNTGSEYVNKNGAIGSPNGVDKNGKIVAAVSLPAVTTTSITSIKGTTASSGGNVTSAGGLSITDRGVCWSTTSTLAPTTSDNKLSQGAGALGNFTSNLTSLAQNTTYYLRAYATNSMGTAYGETVNFTTTFIAIGDSFQGGQIYILEKDGDVVTGGFVVSGEQGTRDRYNIVPVQTAANQSPGLGGYRDWILPNSDQLATICSNRGAIGGFSNSNSYWSADPIISVQSGVNTYYYGYSFPLGATADCSKVFSSVEGVFNVRLIRHFVL